MVNKTRYKHLFFDLDRTLWDYETNSKNAFRVLLPTLPPISKIDPDAFFNLFNRHNEELWLLYRLGKISKVQLRDERFRLVLSDLGLHDVHLTKILSESYIRISPTMSALFPGALETLDYLHDRYSLYIITNGFKEIQDIKMKFAGLEKYFLRMITSDMAGVNKPASGIFHLAISAANARKKECLMIGDEYDTDILGARNFGIDQAFFNYRHQPNDPPATYEIKSLNELLNFL